MIVISVQAAGLQLARGEEAGSFYKYSRLSRSSFQFKEGFIDRESALASTQLQTLPTSLSQFR